MFENRREFVKMRNRYLSYLKQGNEILAATVLDGPSAGAHAYGIRGEALEPEAGFPAVDAEMLWPEERTAVVTAGSCRIYTERLRGRKKLVICGAGHVSLCVLPIARMLGFEICVLEDREMFADKARKAGADRVMVGNFGDLLKEMADDGDTGYLVLTRGHRFDMECLKGILWRKNRTYVGMMCSRSRAEEARARMRSEGFSEEVLASLHAPVGLGIGARTPEEIAVSIMAEIISETGKREAVEIPEEVMGALREKKKCVLAQIISRKGSAPRDAGTKMVIFADGMTVGTIGGGFFEAEVIRYAGELLRGGKSCMLKTIDMSDRAITGPDGSSCGGVVELFFEVLN